MDSPYSLSSLLEHVQQRGPVEYLFFWGHLPKAPGAVDKSCLSNWFPAQFSVGAVTYHSAEQFMMAEKARLFQDRRTLEKILRVQDPARTKRLGRRVRGFTDETWAKHRFGIVASAVEAKFRQNAQLSRFLVDSGDKVLVEASPNDRIWGIGLTENDVRARSPSEWLGLNLLGFALMEARWRIQQI